MLLHIASQLFQGLLRRIMPHEARRQLRSGTIDHRDQVQLLPPTFQPVVFTRVPLHQLPITRTPWTPYVGSLDAASPGSPQLGRSAIATAFRGSPGSHSPPPTLRPPAWGRSRATASLAVSAGTALPPVVLPPPASSGSKAALAAGVAKLCLPPAGAASAVSAPNARCIPTPHRPASG